ncbi:MAG: MnmC family methyltransferase [Cyanobacteria bacterium J06634_5]
MRNAKNKLDSEVLTPVKTGDGSTTFYSSVFGEWYHNRQGAFNEAEKTYIESSQLAHRAKAKTINILDICYGLGYNTAAALETVLAVNGQCQVDLKALEIDLAPSRCAIAQNLIQPYAPPVQQILQDLATHCQSQQGNVRAQILLGDARQQIQPLIAQGWQADIIFLDPFSPPNCPQLWTLEFLQRVAQCLSDDGVLVTYSCAAAVRSALRLANLEIGSIRTGGRKFPGTIARRDRPNGSTHASNASNPGGTDASQKASSMPAPLPALSQQEQEHLQTRAAVPYRDPNLCSTAPEILERRTAEQAASKLAATNPWRRRWQLTQANNTPAEKYTGT